jgi:hypothetical protein
MPDFPRTALARAGDRGRTYAPPDAVRITLRAANRFLAACGVAIATCVRSLYSTGYSDDNVSQYGVKCHIAMVASGFHGPASRERGFRGAVVMPETHTLAHCLAK